jgi:hypothetical protein
LKDLLKICLEKEKKCSEMHLILAIIFYFKLKNKYRALFELSKARNLNPSFEINFGIYRLT